MKTRFLLHAVILIGLLCSTHISFSQIEILPGPDVTPADMVEYLIGTGVYYDNVTYQGADVASGIFNNGSTTNIGIETGIFLTSGSGYVIPGPNNTTSAGVNNGLGGHPLLNMITTATTYDASVLEFDFYPLNDTVKCEFVFGSEEYNEYVGSTFNDVFGFFATGPDPVGGNYNNKNIALIPGTNIPISINTVNNNSFSEYYVDNTNGATIQYDGFTTVITLWVLVIPDETYHFAIAIGDAGDHIYDSGVLLEGTSFKSPGPPEFLSFNFLMEHNPELSFDITGQIAGNEVYLEVPPGTDLTNLVADFEVRGVEVFVDDVVQEPGITPNDFSEPLIYHLEGYAENDWTIHAVIVTGIVQQELHSVVIGPNPSVGKININNVNGIGVKVFNLPGNVVFYQPAYLNEKSLVIDNLKKGIYFVELEKEGSTEIRKIIVK